MAQESCRGSIIQLRPETPCYPSRAGRVIPCFWNLSDVLRETPREGTTRILSSMRVLCLSHPLGFQSEHPTIARGSQESKIKIENNRKRLAR